MAYTPPVNDYLFLLRDVLRVDRLAALPGFADADLDTVEQILGEGARALSR